MRYRFNEGEFYIDSPFILNKNRSSIIGKETVIKIPNNYKYNYVVDCRGSGALSDITIENITFDCSECNKPVRGIIFDSLIYNILFSNINFESFSAAWFYNESNNISENILFQLIQGNCRNKIYKEPLVKIDRLNESNFIGCKFYGKQHHLKPYSKEDLILLDTPQNVNFYGCSFNNTAGIAINVINSKESRIRALNIDKCTFEDCKNPYTIKIIGSNKWRGEYGGVYHNSYIERPGRVLIDNIDGFVVDDLKPSIELLEGSTECVVKTITSNNTEIIDKGNNFIFDYSKM